MSVTHLNDYHIQTVSFTLNLLIIVKYQISTNFLNLLQLLGRNDPKQYHATQVLSYHRDQI